MNPTPRSLTKNIHRNCSQTNRKCQSANNKETIPDTLICNPSINIETQTKRKSVLDKVHRSKGFRCFIAMGVDDIRYDPSGTQLNTEVDEAKTEDDGDGPWVFGCRRLAPCEETDCCEDEI